MAESVITTQPTKVSDEEFGKKSDTEHICIGCNQSTIVCCYPGGCCEGECNYADCCDCSGGDVGAAAADDTCCDCSGGDGCAAEGTGCDCTGCENCDCSGCDCSGCDCNGCTIL